MKITIQEGKCDGGFCAEKAPSGTLMLNRDGTLVIRSRKPWGDSGCVVVVKNGADDKPIAANRHGMTEVSTKPCIA